MLMRTKQRRSDLPHGVSSNKEYISNKRLLTVWSVSHVSARSQSINHVLNDRFSSIQALAKRGSSEEGENT